MESALQEERLKNDINAKPLQSVLDEAPGSKKPKSSRRTCLDLDDTYMEIVKNSQEGLRNSAGRFKSRSYLEKCLTEVTYLVSSHPTISLNKATVSALDTTQSVVQGETTSSQAPNGSSQNQKRNFVASEIMSRRSPSPSPEEGLAEPEVQATTNGATQEVALRPQTEDVPLDEIALENHEQIEKIHHVYDSRGRYVEQELGTPVIPSGEHDPPDTIGEASAGADDVWDFDEPNDHDTQIAAQDGASTTQDAFDIKALLRGHLSAVNAVKTITSDEDLWIISAGAESVVKLHRYPDANPVITLRGHTGLVNSACVMKRSKGIIDLFTGGEDMVIRKWSVNLASTSNYADPIEPVLTFVNHSQPVRNLVIIEGRLISASADGSLRSWDIGSGESKSVWWLPEQFKDVSPVSHCDCGGGTFAVGYTDGQIRHYDSRNPSWSLLIPKQATTMAQSSVTAIVHHTLGPDQSHIISAHEDATIRFYDLRSRQLLRSINAHTSAITSLCFVDSLLASASLDNSVRIWNTESGDCVQEMTTHHNQSGTGVLAIDYNKEGTGGQECLVSAGADGIVAVYLRALSSSSS